MKNKKMLVLLIALSVILAGVFAGLYLYHRSSYGLIKPSKAMSKRIGITHADGKYHLTDDPFMIEGAKAIQELGSKVIKLWLTNNAKELYSFESDWSFETNDIVALAKSAYYDEVFHMPFETYLLEAYEFEGSRQTNWLDGMSEQEISVVEQQIYDLACYFYEEFEGTGKTFILQNWEGDNALGSLQIKQADGKLSTKGQTAIDGMVAWINARQAGVTRARKEYENSGVIVANAMEVNLIDVDNDRENYENRVLAVDYIVPKTNCDLYSLSCWGAKETGLESVVADKLQYYKTKAPPSTLYGKQNIMLGEFGSPEFLHKTKMFYDEASSKAQMENVKLQIEYALKEDVRYAIYWELYCNESRNPGNMVDGQCIKNEDCSGYWLLRQDGSKTDTYHYLKELLKGSVS